MTKQQTAVEWLEQKLKESGISFLSEEMEYFKEAKAMFRQQIEDAFQDGKWDWHEHITNGIESKDLAQYYNEKYGSWKQEN
jgi:hypothetical protein